MTINILVTLIIVCAGLFVYGSLHVWHWRIGLRRAQRMTYVNNAWARAIAKPVSYNEYFWALDQATVLRTAVHASSVGADRVAYV
jgi:hypothetical protein